MLKPLSKCAQIELEIERKFRGQLWAYTAVTNQAYGFSLGIATANEPGYTPISGWWSHSDSWDEMNDHADALNAERGQTPDQSMRIVCSSMAAGKVGNEWKRAVGF